MKRLFLLSLFLTACTAQAQNTPILSPSPSFTPAANFSTPDSRSKRFTLKLTLTDKEDLKVREGDVVVKDQVLMDRVRDRQRLEAQKQQILIQLQRLKQPPIQPLIPKRIPDVAAFPAASFLEEQATIDKLTLQVEKATRDRDLQQRYLDTVQTLEGIPASTLQHEQEKLKQKEGLLREAIAELEVSRAKLDKSKREYQYKEYQYSLELSKREIDIQRQQQEYQRQMQEWEKQERDRNFQIAQITARLQEIETQLAALSVTRSQYNAKVQRVKWLGQDNQALNVELTLIVADPREFTRRDKDTDDTADNSDSPTSARQR